MRPDLKHVTRCAFVALTSHLPLSMTLLLLELLDVVHSEPNHVVLMAREYNERCKRMYSDASQWQSAQM